MGIPEPDAQRRSHTYLYPPIERVIYGAGALNRLGHEIDRLGVRRALIVTTPSVSRTPLIERVQRIVGPSVAATFTGVRPHSPASVVARLTEEAVKHEVDGVISLGGGSAIDTAKAACVSLAETTGIMPPHVALPTTLSAAEFSPTFGVTDDVTLAKTSHRVPASAARVIVLDPDLTVYTPEWLWLSSGIRALDHAIETVYAPDHQIVADVPALEAIRLLFRHLEAARDPSAIDDRASCQIAAWLSFFAVANITLGPSHMLGRQIGPRYGAPHGYTSAVLLPAAMTSLLPSTRREQERIARAIRHGLDADEPAGAAHAAEAVYGLVDRLGLPHRLRDLKVPRDDLPSLAGGSPALLAILTAGW